MKRRNLRAELIRNTVYVTTLSLGVFMIGSLIHLRFGMNNAVDQQLLDIGPDILGQLSARSPLPEGESLPVFLTLFDERNLIRLLEVRVTGREGFYRNPRYRDLLEDYRNESLDDPEEEESGGPLLRTLWYDGRSWRVAHFEREGMEVLLAADLGGIEKPLLQILIAFVFSLPIAAAAAGLVGLWQARRISDPIERLAGHARGLNVDRLDERIRIDDAAREVVELGEALNLMTDRLEMSFAQARRFSADASHELKTPLTIMQGILESRLQEKESLELEHEDGVRLLEATQRLKAIVEGLLVLAKADEGSLLQSVERVEMKKLLQEVASDAQLLSEAEGATFEAVIPDIPTLHGDGRLLRIAIHNLVNNAVQHCREGGVVRMNAEVMKDSLNVSVFNTGLPIPEQDWNRIFDRFVSLSGDRRGIGLGLNLARAIARAHKGEIRLERSNAEGTEFRLRLPLFPRSDRISL